MEPEQGPTVAVVLLNYNGRALLRQFLPNVLLHSAGYQVIVADNGSTDGSLELLSQEFPQVRVIALGTNLGFCGGYNEALRQVETTYYVLLNTDVEVTNHWLQPMVDLLEGNPHIAACQPKIKSFQRRQFLEYAGAAGGFLDRWGYPFCRGRLFDSLEKDQGQYNDVQPVFWASGACLLIRSSAFWEAGALDPEFFAHMEEIDLCWRLQNGGHLIYYCGSSEVYHVGGGTLAQNDPRKIYLNFRNGLALLYKNLPEDKLKQTIWTRLVLDGVAASRMFLSGDWRGVKAIYAAHQYYFKNRKAWEGKREMAGTKKGLGELHGFYPKSVVWQYFGQGKKKFGDLDVPDGASLPA